jgi:hypothetical protein
MNRRKTCKERKARLGLVAMLAILLALISTVPGLAQSGPDTMNFQGRLLDNSGNPLGGVTRCMRFRMCSDSGCTTQVWPGSGYEYHAVTTESGTYKAGLFTVALGSNWDILPTLLYDYDTLYLEIGVADETTCPGTNWTLLTPRSQLRANAYAQRARRVRTQEGDDTYLVSVANTGSGGGVYAQTGSTTSGIAAGYFYATASSGCTYGVHAKNDSTTTDASAGYFKADGSSGQTYGVRAYNNSTTDLASAGYFEAEGGSGHTYGVRAYNNSSSSGATAGLFAAESNSGQTHGVVAMNNSTTGFASAGSFYAQGSSGQTYAVKAKNDSPSTGAAAGYFDGADIGVYGYSYSGTPLKVQSYLAANLIEAWEESPDDLRFKVERDGDVYIDGTYYDTGADFAEMLPGVDGLEAGDVLVIGPDSQLACSTEAYDSAVVGVYSTKPAFVGGSDEEMENPGKVPLAITGIAPVKTSAENGPIRPGDLLTASSIPGHAMRCEGVQLCFGRTIGKALEGLESGTGVISMLVMLQ